MPMTLYNVRRETISMAWQLREGLLGDSSFPFLQFTTTRDFGNMRDPAARASFFELLCVRAAVSAQQVHGSRVAVVNDKFSGKELPQTDALVTGEPGLALCIFTADCMPVFFADKKKKVVALAHAGWRGLAGGIAKATLSTMEKQFGCQPRDISVSVGPHIHSCCFEIGDEVRSAFGVSGSHLDMSGVLKSQLEECGVENISFSGQCTKHNKDLFFSYRREKNAERLMSVVCI
jgi:YfiH family protein